MRMSKCHSPNYLFSHFTFAYDHVTTILQPKAKWT